MKDFPFSIPLLLTAFRLIVAPPFFIVFIAYSQDSYLLQLLNVLVFIVVALTDFFDGYCARLLKQESFLGTLLDPFADKVFLLSVIIPLVSMSVMPVSVAFCIVVRELWVTALRESAALLHKRIHVSNSGKIKTFLQLMYVGWLLTRPLLGDTDMLDSVTSVLMVAALISTFYSGFEYTLQYVRLVS